MMSRHYGGSMMGGSPGGWMMGRQGYQWMMGGASAPGWMRGGRLPGSMMMGGTTDPGQIMGKLRADAPGPRIGAAQAIRLGSQIPAGAHSLVITASSDVSSWMHMMTDRPAFAGSALWFLGNPTTAGMHTATLTFTAAGQRPARRAREGNRGTTLTPARPPHTPNAGSSDKPLPGPGHHDTSRDQSSHTLAVEADTVAVFLGIPLAARYLTRTLGERFRGREWYESRFLPRIAPVALYGLLFTVVILFALQGRKITAEPADVARIALPLLAYFAIMWAAGFAVSRRLRLSYPRTAALSFSAASNDFELAIAVAIGVFGVTSGQALAGVVGPLIEVPVMLGFAYIALRARRHYYSAGQEDAP